LEINIGEHCCKTVKILWFWHTLPEQNQKGCLQSFLNFVCRICKKKYNRPTYSINLGKSQYISTCTVRTFGQIVGKFTICMHAHMIDFQSSEAFFGGNYMPEIQTLWG